MDIYSLIHFVHLEDFAHNQIESKFFLGCKAGISWIQDCMIENNGQLTILWYDLWGLVLSGLTSKYALLAQLNYAWCHF